MYPKNIQNKELQKDISESLCGLDDCEVSKASTELMLDRFCNGKEIDFPFSQ
tara:strand:- start:26 stop:181 length:156 start_codon:yes stop_codon:yes gene_type:complete